MSEAREMLAEADAFSDAARDAVYRAIFTRRDVRSQFLPEAIAPEILARLLMAAHHAPSVGFMQPWDFIVITDAQTRMAMKEIFAKANAEAVHKIEKDRAALYASLKLEGILEAPVNLCVTCTRTRDGETGLGRTHMPEMDLYSTVCAVQNLWLAARAEGIGVGWVSIVEPVAVRRLLGIPEDSVIIAYLCLGYVSGLYKQPELEHAGWGKRLNLENIVHGGRWGEKPESMLAEHLRAQQEKVQNGAFLREKVPPTLTLPLAGGGDNIGND